MVAACGDDDDAGGDEASRQELIDIATTLATTDGSGATEEEIDYYFAHVTDAFLQEFGAESIEACRADAAECIGDPLTNVSVDPATVEVDGDAGALVVASSEGEFGINVRRENDVWKADGLFVPDDSIPEGAQVIELGLIEFAFDGDFESETVKSGDFAFHVANNGQQAHEVILVELPAEGALEDLIEDESFEPEPIFVKFPYGPGEDSDVALPEPLEAGRYAFLCFLPDTDDPDGTPHAFKGMATEFRVG